MMAITISSSIRVKPLLDLVLRIFASFRLGRPIRGFMNDVRPLLLLGSEQSLSADARLVRQLLQSYDELLSRERMCGTSRMVNTLQFAPINQVPGA